MRATPFTPTPAYQKLMHRIYRLGQMQMHLKRVDSTYFRIMRRSRLLYQMALDVKQWPADALGVPVSRKPFIGANDPADWFRCSD